MYARNYSPFDRLLMQVDKAARTLLGPPPVGERPNPADSFSDADLCEEDRRKVSALMRVNHAGEVSAQALYQGQALTAKLLEVRGKMERAAREENDHLAWCQRRLGELGSHTSFLNPLWYVGSLAIGALAGLAGDRWSLGFVAETERQVVIHLEEHLERLPAQDHKSRAILARMKEDEAHHATTALRAGGAELPQPVKRIMRLSSKVMTTTAYYI